MSQPFVVYKMAKITAIRRTARGQRLKIFVDGKPSFTVGRDTMAGQKLKVGQDLAPSHSETLGRASEIQRALKAALRYVHYRPRSESELKRHLGQLGFADEDSREVISQLKDHGLADDAAFARFWRDNREAFRPCSRRLITQELRRKGVSYEAAEQAIAGLDDEESAYQAAWSKASKLPRTDYETFHRRLQGYLVRRGFSYEISEKSVKRLWQETGGKSESAL